VLPNLDPDVFILPDSSTAGNYIDAYFIFANSVYPVVHKHTFINCYHDLLDSGTGRDVGKRMEHHKARPTFLALVNLVFAMGCQFSTIIDPSRRSKLSDKFYQRSRSLLASDSFLDNPTIEVVQILLLTTIYLQSTQHAGRCWNTLGAAIRAAQAIGLHLEQRHATCMRQLDRELGRRIWHSCVVLDKMQSMTFGRPAMLGKSKVESPQLIDDKYLQNTSTDGSLQPPGVESQLAFFTQCIKLFDILSDVLSTIYPYDDDDTASQNPPRTRITGGSQQFQDIMRLSAELDRFENGIPHFLRPINSPNTDMSVANDNEASRRTAIFSLQANVLNCRCLYIRLILLRPLLLHTCFIRTEQINDNGLPSLELYMFHRASMICLNTAVSLLSSIHTHMHSALRNSVWHTVYFTFSAATVLLVSQIQQLRGPPSQQQLQPSTTPYWASSLPKDGLETFHHIDIFSQAAFEDAWSKAVDILNYHTDRARWAGRALQVLEALRLRAMSPRVAPSGSKCQDLEVSHSTLPFPQMEGDVITASVETATDSWFLEHIINLDFFEMGLL